jgi:hypothetical protein
MALSKYVLTASKTEEKTKSKSKTKTNQPLRYSERDALHGFLMFQGNCSVSLGALDSMAQTSVCEQQNVPPEAYIIAKDDGTRIQGVGGQITNAGTLYAMEFQIRIGAPKIVLKFRLAPLSTPGLQFLVDYEQIRDVLGAVIDPVRSIVTCEKLGLSFKTEPIQILHHRMRCPPIRTLGACGGMATDLLALLEMGINVKEHILIDTDPIAVEVALANFSSTSTKITVIRDIRDAHGSDIGHIDHATFSPICGPWSCLVNEPRGFAHPDAQTFRECGRLRKELQIINDQISTVFETNKIHPSLQHEEETQEQLAGGKFFMLNAAAVGSPSSRPRRFSCNNMFVKIEKNDLTSCADPNRFLTAGWRSLRSPTPCLVSAGASTRDPVIVHTALGKHTERFIFPDEADGLNGLTPGYSNAFGKVKVSTKDRIRLTGQCLNQFHLRVIFRYVNMISMPTTKMVAQIRAPSRESNPEALELYLINLSFEDKVKHILKDLDGFEKPKLTITTKDPNQLPYHTKIIPDVKPALTRSIQKKLAKMCEMGRVRILDKVGKQHWLSPAFVKEKKGRVDADGDPLIRMLCDCVVVNGVTQLEAWWTEFVCKIEDFKAEFSHTDKYFAVIDLMDAFEMMLVELDSQKYLCFVIRVDGKIVVFQAIVCIQGLALSAYFFPIWWARLCWAAFGFAYLQWWAAYVDDNIVKGPTRERTEGRVEIFRAFCKATDVGISPKTPGDVKTEVTGAGIVISEHGLRADDTVEEALRMRLDVKVRGIKQARNLRGVIESARTAFLFDVGQQHKFAELMQPMHKAIAKADKESKFPTQEWIEKVEPSIETLKQFIKIVNRAHIHPDSLITEDSSIIFYGDSSDEAAGVGVYQVKIPDARDVKIPEDLQDPMISIMAMCFARGHSDDKIDWLTYQNETELMVEALEKMGKRITAALMKFDLKSGICKVGVYTDSSTGRSIAHGLNNPAAKPEHHTAMSRKWLNWSARTYYTRFWNAHFGYCEGIKNDFSDWLSHIGHLLKDAGRRLSSRHAEGKTKQVQESRTKDKASVEQQEFPIPIGWNAENKTLKLQTEDWNAISEATAIDKESIYHKVTLSEIHNTLTGNGETSALAKDRVRSWRQKMFAVCPEGSKKPVLMVPQTMSRNEADVFSGKGFDDELDMQSKDKFKNLITVIPANAKCRISTITQLDGEDEPPLRHDILLLMHEFAAHQGEPYMYEQITEFAWWPSLRTDIRNHIKYCSVCMAKLAARRSAGIGTVISVRFRHLSGDHAILPKWIQEITGYYSVFTIMDLGSGDFMLVPSKTNTPEEAVAIIFNHWIRHRGLFYTFTSDQGSPFVAKVMAAFQKLIGVKIHKFTAVHDSRGAASVEAKNKVVRDMQHEVSENF